MRPSSETVSSANGSPTLSIPALSAVGANSLVWSLAIASSIAARRSGVSRLWPSGAAKTRFRTAPCSAANSDSIRSTAFCVSEPGISNSSLRLPPTPATRATSATTIPTQAPTTRHGCVATARIQRASPPVESRSCAVRRSRLGSSAIACVPPGRSVVSTKTGRRPGTHRSPKEATRRGGRRGSGRGPQAIGIAGGAAERRAAAPEAYTRIVASRLPAILRRRRVVVGLQLALLAGVIAFFAYVLRDVWADAVPLLADTDPVFLVAALGVLAAYYLLFAVGWWWLLRAIRIRVSYGIALQAEMASMLAKYIPGGIWTPLARIVWLRRAGGVSDTSFVISSILLEAGLSAVAGILVFTVGLAVVETVEVAVIPLFTFAVVVAVLLHPRVFTALTRAVFRRFGAPEPTPLPYRVLVGLLGYYACTWLVGGAALYLLLRSLGTDPGLETIPYLGGAAAVGAIVAVLTVFAPSGLGVREASMYGLLVVVVPAAAALGATVLNRLAITLVEAALLLGALLVTRLRRIGAGSPVAADGEVDERPEDREEDGRHNPDGLLAAGDARVPENADDRHDDQHERDDPYDRPEPVDHA